MKTIPSKSGAGLSPGSGTLGNPGSLRLASGSLGLFPAASYGFNNLFLSPEISLNLNFILYLRKQAQPLAVLCYRIWVVCVSPSIRLSRWEEGDVRYLLPQSPRVKEQERKSLPWGQIFQLLWPRKGKMVVFLGDVAGMHHTVLLVLPPGTGPNGNLEEQPQ